MPTRTQSPVPVYATVPTFIMDFQNEMSSKTLRRDDYDQNFQEIVQLIKGHQCRQVDILFGVGWRLEYKDFTPFKVSFEDIFSEVRIADELEVGKFGQDDFSIIINELSTEVLFCHEMDIHLFYNQDNPVIDRILRVWHAKELIQMSKIKSGYHCLPATVAMNTG